MNSPLPDNWNYMGMGGLEVSSIIINPTSGAVLAFTSSGSMYVNNSPLTSVGEEKPVVNPDIYTLAQNYPNPFNPSTIIEFTLPDVADVVLKIYDITGKEITTLANGSFEKGTHKIAFNAINLPSGIYFYRIQAGNFVEVKRMVLLK
jgi:hypothetical protein